MVAHNKMDTRKRKSDVPDRSTVKKCLFGKPDKDDKDEVVRRFEQKNLLHLEKMKVKYGYDFIEDKNLHLDNTPYTVAKVVETSHKKDLNGMTSSISVANEQTRNATTPYKQCLDEGNSESKFSKNKSINGTLSERKKAAETNGRCEDDKTTVASNTQL